MKHPRIIELEKKVIAKLKAEGLNISSPWENIVACLSETVAPNFCLSCAKDLREENLKSAFENKPEQRSLFE